MSTDKPPLARALLVSCIRAHRGSGLIFTGRRIKDSLRRRGENLSSFEIERPIAEHPAVADVAVVAVPADHDGGEDEVKACVILKAGQTMAADELHRWCRQCMPAFAVPSVPRKGAERRARKSRDEALKRDRQRRR